MRKKSVKILLICALVLLLLVPAMIFTIGQLSGGGNTAKEFSELKVKEEAQIAAGKDYYFEQPVVFYGDKEATISILVEFDGNVIPHDNKTLYVDSVGQYIITYKASAEGQSITATTVLTATDAEGPVIVSKLQSLLKINKAYILDEYISARDISGAEIVGYEIEDMTSGEGKELAKGQYDPETKTLKLSDSAVKVVRITANAKDANGHTGSRNIEIDVVAQEYCWFSMDVIEQYTSISSRQTGRPWQWEAVVEDGLNAVQGVYQDTYPMLAFTMDELKDLAKCDYICVRYKINYSDNTGVVGMTGTTGMVYNAPSSVTEDNGWTIATWRKDTAIGEKVFPYIARTGTVELAVYAYAGKECTTTLTVAEIYGGYDPVRLNEKPVDLTAKIGLPAEEFAVKFTDSNGKQQELSDLKNFNSALGGTLSIFVNKEGYLPTDLTVKVFPPPYYGYYPTSDIDLFESVMSTVGTKAFAVKPVVDGKDKALQTVFKGSYPKMTFVSEDLKTLVDFDYITIRFKVSYSESGGTVGLSGTTGAVYNDADIKTVVDGWNVWTWHKNGKKGEDIFPYIAKTGNVQLSVYAWAGKETTITVAEIYGGFDQIKSDGVTAVNLAERTGLASGEFKASFTPSGSEQSFAVENTSFLAQNSGVLTLSVKKAGYSLTQFKVNVSLQPKYGIFPADSKLNFDSVEAFVSSKAFEVREVTANGQTALEAKYDGDYPMMSFKSDDMKSLSDFDYITIRFKVSYSESGGSVGLLGTTGSVYNDADTKTVVDGWNVWTWHKNGKNGEDIFPYIAKTGNVQLSVYAWAGKETTITVAEIYGGFDPVKVDGDTVVNLADQFGLGVDEFTATFSPASGDGKFIELSTGNKADFSAVNVGNNGSEATATEVDDNGYKALQADMTGMWPSLSFQDNKLKALADCDYISIRFKVSYSESGGTVGLRGTNRSVYNNADSMYTEDGWNVWTWRKDSAAGEDIFPYIAQTGNVQLSVYAWAGKETTLTVAEIVGGYDPMEDVTKFVTDANGELKLVINKPGYRRTEMVVPVTTMPAYGMYPTAYIKDFNSVISSYGTVTEVVENGDKAIKAELAASNWDSLCFRDEKLKVLGNMDYITIRLKVTYPGGGTIGLTGHDKSGYNYQDTKVTVSDGWVEYTWVKELDSDANAFGYIKDTGIVELNVNDWAGTGSTLIVAEIYGGYNPIVSDGETAFDLTDKLGLTAEEFTASFKPDGGEAAAVTDVTNFVPSGIGELTVTVNKAGYKATDFNLKVTCLPEYGKYPTANTEDFTNNSSGTLTEVTEGGFSAISCETSGNTWNQIKLHSDKLKDLAKFDYVKVRYKAVNVNGAGMDLYFGVSGCRASSTVTDGEWTVGTWRKDATNGTAAFAELANGRVNLIMNAWTAAGNTPKSVLMIAEVIGGYDDIVTDGETAIDLTDRLGLTAEEFTASFKPDGGEAAAVTDVTSFAPTTSGELTVTVNKEGYMATDFVLAVTVPKYPTANIADFSSVTSKYGTVTEADEGGIKAIKVVTAASNWDSLCFRDEKLKVLGDMDYITVRLKVTYPAGGSIGLTGYDKSGYNYQDTKVSVSDGWVEYTWVKELDSDANAFGYIKDTGIVELNVNDWAGTGSTLIVAEIYGGYGAVAPDDPDGSDDTIQLPDVEMF